jgi:hypothetical protein
MTARRRENAPSLSMSSSHRRLVKTSNVDLATMSRRNYLIRGQPSTGMSRRAIPRIELVRLIRANG